MGSPFRCGWEHGTLVDQARFHGFAQILHEMEPIDHLQRLGSTPANAIGIQLTPITTNDGNTRIACEPLHDRVGSAIGQAVEHLMIGEIDEDHPIPTTAPPCPFVNADDRRESDRWEGSGTDSAQQRGRTGWETQSSSQPRTWMATKREPKRRQSSIKTNGFARIGSCQLRQALGENPARTGSVPTEKFANEQLEADGLGAPGQIGQVPLVATMSVRRWSGTAGARCGWGSSGQFDQQPTSGMDVTDDTNSSGRRQQGREEGLDLMTHGFHGTTLDTDSPKAPKSPDVMAESPIQQRCAKEIALLEAGYPVQTIASNLLALYRKALREAMDAATLLTQYWHWFADGAPLNARGYRLRRRLVPGGKY